MEETRQNSLKTLAAVDRAVTEMLDKTEVLGLTKNTIVIFTSDNGLMFGEH